MTRIIAAALALIATTAIAHEGVQNAAVKARMELMKQVGANTKVLGDMAKGTAVFDADAARTAAANLATLSTRVPAAFEANEDDPKSEARPAIWQNFGDFTAKSQAMGAAARSAASQITSLDSLRAELGKIGKTCGSCHEAYRE